VVEPGQSMEGLLVEAEGLYNKNVLEKDILLNISYLCTHLNINISILTRRWISG